MLDLFHNRNYVENPYNNFFEIRARDIDKNIINFSEYKNKVCLVVNYCPKTDNLQNMIELKNKFSKDSFEILAFPSCENEKIYLSNKEMKDEILKNDTDGIKVFNRVYLNGDEIAEVYKYCLRNSNFFDIRKGTAQRINKKFEKFLIKKNGKLYGYFHRDILIDEIEENIKNLLSDKNENISIRKDYINYNKYI